MNIVNQTPSNTTKSLANSEAGFVLVLISASIAVLFLLIGLVTDYGLVFKAKVHLRGAADAGSFAASTARLQGEDQAQAAQRAKEIVALNVTANGFKPENISQAVDPSRFRVTYIGDSDSRVDTSIHQTLPLLSPLVGLPSQAVATTATTTVKPLAIELVLDVSQSMLSVRDSSNVLLPAHEQPLTKLKVAVIDFLNLLDPTKDIIGITEFANDGVVLAPVNPAGGFDRVALTNIINSLTVGPNTNHAAGLYAGWTDLKRVKLFSPNAELVVLMMTDGGASASDIQIPSARTKGAMLASGNSLWTTYEWGEGIHDFIYGMDSWLPKNASLYAVRGTSTLNWAGCNPAQVLGPYPVPDPRANYCAPTRLIPSCPQQPDWMNAVHNNCLIGPNIPIQDPNGRVYEVPYDPADTDYRDAFGHYYVDTINYYAGVVISDWIRAEDGRVFVFGLGQDYTTALNPADPLGDMEYSDRYSRKLYNARLALAPSCVGNAQYASLDTCAAQILAGRKQGQFETDPDASTYQPWFQNLMRRLKIILKD